jgi:hypothetical protein
MANSLTALTHILIHLSTISRDIAVLAAPFASGVQLGEDDVRPIVGNLLESRSKRSGPWQTRT